MFMQTNQPTSPTTSPRVITEASISAMPSRLFDPMPTVTVTYSDGVTEKLFTYYPDEISFYPEEFVGKSEEQAHALFTKKDVAFLQS